MHGIQQSFDIDHSGAFDTIISSNITHDKVLPYGLCCAQCLLNVVAHALCYICHELFHVVNLIHLTVWPSWLPVLPATSRSHLVSFRSIGIPFAREKTEGPTTTLTFLGIVLDFHFMLAGFHRKRIAISDTCSDHHH